MDGGETLGYLMPFPSEGDELTVPVNLPANTEINLVVAVFNAYDRRTNSNAIEIAAIILEYPSEIPVEQPVEPQPVVEEEVVVIEDEEVSVDERALPEPPLEDSEIAPPQDNPAPISDLIISLIVAVVLLVALLFVSRLVLYKKLGRKRQRQQGVEDDEDA
jgi:hypothetical protein